MHTKKEKKFSVLSSSFMSFKYVLTAVDEVTDAEKRISFKIIVSHRNLLFLSYSVKTQQQDGKFIQWLVPGRIFKNQYSPSLGKTHWRILFIFLTSFSTASDNESFCLSSKRNKQTTCIFFLLSVRTKWRDARNWYIQLTNSSVTENLHEIGTAIQMHFHQ